MPRTRRTSTRAVALSAVIALTLAACGSEDPTVDVAAPEATDQGQAEEPEADAPADAPTDDPAAEDAEDAEEPAEDAEVDAASEPDAGPTPVAAQVDDPCAAHEGREGDAFIEVVSPVSDQEVPAGEVDLVGCSNVYEANVQWSLYDGDGVELDSGSTAAECGTGCVGAFSETISLDAADGEPFAELHVYAEDASGAGDRLYETAIPLVLS